MVAVRTRVAPDPRLAVEPLSATFVAAPDAMVRFPVPVFCCPPAVVARTVNVKVPATVVDADVWSVSVEVGKPTVMLVGEKEEVTEPVTAAGVPAFQPTKVKLTGSSLLVPLPL